MKFEILQENLNIALNQLARIIPSKPQLPVLSGILLEVSENNISLAATDLYVGISTQVQGKILKPGKTVIPGRIFQQSISSLDAGKLEISLKENTLTIKANNNVTTIQCLAVDDFPDFPQIEGEKYQLSKQSFDEIESRVGFSASLDLTRPVLTSLLFGFTNEGLQVVGTDGFRLATLMLNNEKTLEKNSFLLPAKAISEIVRVNQQNEDDQVAFQVSEELKQALFEIGNTKLYVRLIEGEFPPYERIIPSEFEKTYLLDGEELENLLKRALVFARESSNIVKLSVDKKELKVTAQSPAYGVQEGQMLVETNYDGKSEIAFNLKYLLDFLNTVKPEKVELLMNGSLEPALFRPEGEMGYRYIVMPFRIN